MTTHLLLQPCPAKSSSWCLSHQLFKAISESHSCSCSVLHMWTIVTAKSQTVCPLLHEFPHRPQGTPQASCFLLYIYDTKLDNLWRGDSEDCSWLRAQPGRATGNFPECEKVCTWLVCGWSEDLNTRYLAILLYANDKLIKNQIWLWEKLSFRS